MEKASGELFEVEGDDLDAVSAGASCELNPDG